MTKIAPSILSADFSAMGETVEKLILSGADYIHCDVMDGNFVPSITFGAKMVSDIKKHSTIPLDVHLMVNDPSRHIENFASSGADIITFHMEADTDPRRTIDLIKSFGCRAGVVLNPTTDIEWLSPLISYCDIVVVMGVVAGKGAQKFIPSTLMRLKHVRDMADRLKLNIDIEIDGGVTEDNINEIISYGANVIVAGNAVFTSNDMSKTIKRLRGF